MIWNFRVRKGYLLSGAIIAAAVVGVAVVWVSANESVYVVKSGSMYPTLKDKDAVFAMRVPFSELAVNDIIIFGKTFEDVNRTYIHRIVEIYEENGGKVVKTKGDYNESSLEGVDFPITEEDYIAKVEFAIPYGGLLAEMLSPPINYVALAILFSASTFWFRKALVTAAKGS